MAEILLYGVIGDTYDKLDAATVCEAVRGSTGPLSVRINSPGGYVMEGLAIIQALRSYPSTVTVYIDGLAASMGSAIAMVGQEIIMAESALMMIHRPWDSSIGNADDMRRDAAVLDKIEQQLVGIYAKQTGLPEGEISAMLAAETWFTADEAFAAGFVTSIAQPLKIAAMADVSPFGFRHTPDQLKEQTMPGDTTAAVALERTRISSIMALGAKHGAPVALTQRLIDGGTALDASREAILDYLADRDDRAGIGHTHTPHGSMGHTTLDDPNTYASAMVDAMVAKIGGRPAEGAASQFRHMTVVDMARDFLARGGERGAQSLSADRVMSMALRSGGGPTRSFGTGAGYNLGGLHGTGDFPDLIGGAAEKFLIDRYKLQESPLKLLASVRDRPNFLMHYGVQTGGIGLLDQVDEHAEFKNKTISTRKEGYKIETYGNIFGVSRQLLINDALGALADILTVMAAATTEIEATLLAALINANPLMSDGKAWFSVEHGNLGSPGAPPTIAEVDKGRLAMRSQRDLDGVGHIDAKPKYLVVPVNLETQAEVLCSSVTAPGTQADLNPFAGKLEPMADPRLSSSAAWFMFADPATSPALQISYLDGNRTPFLDTQEGWRVDGTEYKVRHDFGAGILDWRFAYKDLGQ